MTDEFANMNKNRIEDMLARVFWGGRLLFENYVVIPASAHTPYPQDVHDDLHVIGIDSDYDCINCTFLESRGIIDTQHWLNEHSYRACLFPYAVLASIVREACRSSRIQERFDSLEDLEELEALVS